jgi:hypothetical protein
MATLSTTVTDAQVTEFKASLGTRLTRNDESRSAGAASNAEVSAFILQHVKSVVVGEGTRGATATAEATERARLTAAGW